MTEQRSRRVSLAIVIVIAVGIAISVYENLSWQTCLGTIALVVATVLRKPSSSWLYTTALLGAATGLLVFACVTRKECVVVTNAPVERISASHSRTYEAAMTNAMAATAARTTQR